MSPPFAFLGSSTPRPRIQLSQVPDPPPLDEYDEQSCDFPPDALSSHSTRHLAIRTPFLSSASSSPDLSAQAADHPSNRLLYPRSVGYPGDNYVHSPYSTASNTPVPSRTPSPAQFYSSGPSSCSSDSESELDDSPFARSAHHHLNPRWREREEHRRWWIMGAVRRRRRRERIGGWRALKRGLRLLIRHPFFPKTPITILLTLLLLTIFGVSLTFLIIYILNPDKEPLPWRGYCTIPQFSTAPPSLSLPTTASFPYPLPENFIPPSFPPPDLDDLSPAGLFVGVFSMDNAVERRMLIRSSWASHQRSRDGAGEGDGGMGTSRTIVRFILGQPSKEWQRRVRLEMEMYNDIVILPVTENMNEGKTYAYFSWASRDAWVPPLYFDSFEHEPTGLSYANATSFARVPAHHDPIYARQDYATGEPRRWVRPDYVVKTDDDAFVMLAELEARLRVELHRDPHEQAQLFDGTEFSASSAATFAALTSNYSGAAAASNSASSSSSNPTSSPDTSDTSVAVKGVIPTNPSGAPDGHEHAEPAGPTDPLIFWGYLVKNRFMAGELYALSWSLVDWLAHDPQVNEMQKGAEDKQTSKWMRLHPRAEEVRWVSERCWIYDHPRAGTVYSHGFLFPSEVTRVQQAVMEDIKRALPAEIAAQTTGAIPSPFGPNAPIPSHWALSTVSKFGTRYNPPLPYLSQETSIEALVEGSEMSMLTEGSGVNPWTVWRRREGRTKKYEYKRVGGTVVVHFIKKNMWFLETAAAFLLGEDETEAERGYHWVKGGVHQIQDVVVGDDTTPSQAGQHPIQTNNMRKHTKRR